MHPFLANKLGGIMRESSIVRLLSSCGLYFSVTKGEMIELLMFILVWFWC